ATLGVFQVPPADTEQAVSAALRAGYRHIDTAAAYRSQRERAIADSDVPCDQLYVVTKLPNSDQGYDSVPVHATGISPAAGQLGLQPSFSEVPSAGIARGARPARQDAHPGVDLVAYSAG